MSECIIVGSAMMTSDPGQLVEAMGRTVAVVDKVTEVDSDRGPYQMVSSVQTLLPIPCTTTAGKLAPVAAPLITAAVRGGMVRTDTPTTGVSNPDHPVVAMSTAPITV